MGSFDRWGQVGDTGEEDREWGVGQEHGTMSWEARILVPGLLLISRDHLIALLWASISSSVQ